ncbi:hypothetical protein H5410_055783 [Solanum commersonii]|uniref:DUF4283 domain-containing protein n=1 Tax=Solanum commersonii TaxID=4109 RepID=A0A9J5WIH8_SOLCO|nr:hypothetical protein H5410_055783 [Solanum commersonii]
MKLRKPIEHLVLIDLDWDFYIAKFTQQQNMDKAIHGGPWFILGSFLSVKCWESNFAPKESTITHSAIWIRLPQLPNEFYDKSILENIGKKFVSLLKIDACTFATLRGRYARICIKYQGLTSRIAARDRTLRTVFNPNSVHRYAADIHCYGGSLISGADNRRGHEPGNHPICATTMDTSAAANIPVQQPEPIVDDGVELSLQPASTPDTLFPTPNTNPEVLNPTFIPWTIPEMGVTQPIPNWVGNLGDGNRSSLEKIK